MKLTTFILALLGLLTITFACNEGEKKCCSDWFGCQCEGGRWKNKHGCQKGTYCQMKNGDWTCKSKILLSRAGDEDIVGLPIGPIAVPGAPIDAHDANTQTEPVPSDIAAIIENIPSVVRGTANPSDYKCGFCIDTKGVRSDLSGLHKCNTLAHNEQYKSCSNQWCGICMIFSGEACQGTLLHWGGPGAGSYDATGGRSHYCY